jgi:class 3 adenylate cyclase
VLGVINEIALGVAARPSTQRLHRFLAERIADVVGASTATLALREDDGPAGGDAAASGGSWRVAAVHPQLTGTAEVVGQVGQTELLGALAGQLAAADQWHSDDGRQIVLSIRYGGDVVGALWLRRDGAAQPFDADDRVLLRLLANEAAVVMETGRLIDGYLTQQQEQFRLRAILEQYVSTSVAERLISGEVGTTLEGERRVVTVFMADMRNSTQLTTALDPAETVALLNEYLGLLTDIVFGYEGTIEKIEGDGVAVLFGAPVGHEDDPLRAVRAAAVAQREVLALLERWRRRFPVPASIGMGIGIATGELIVGNVGSAKLLHYTTTGPTINLAARLTSRAPAGTAQLDETTWRAVAQPLGLARGRRPRRPRHIRAKGFPHLVPTYRLGPRDLVAVS